LTKGVIRIEQLSPVRTAAATEKALANLSSFPYFVHKWTKQIRHYTLGDLTLPEALFVRGIWPSWNSPVVSVGGTRTPTVETFCLVSAVIRELARKGVLIISGGVPGVDLAAHIAAADEEMGATMAVLANPVDRGLGGHEWFSVSMENQLLKRGALVSEYSRFSPIESDEFSERLLARDRIISGLCDIFLVFECNEDSATVDTARRALAQGKRIICIDSVRKSARRGVNQLVAEFDLPVLDERKLEPSNIADQIVGELGKLLSYLRTAEHSLTDPVRGAI
jgi:predicted Rossmann fold nucleotide-binding protein DprA/Smf involved in DNA uptake